MLENKNLSVFIEPVHCAFVPTLLTGPYASWVWSPIVKLREKHLVPFSIKKKKLVKLNFFKYWWYYPETLIARGSFLWARDALQPSFSDTSKVLVCKLFLLLPGSVEELVFPLQNRKESKKKNHRNIQTFLLPELRTSLGHWLKLLLVLIFFSYKLNLHKLSFLLLFHSHDHTQQLGENY